MLEVISPFDGKHIDNVKTTNEAEVEKILSEAYAIFQDKKQYLKHHERIAILNKLANLVEEQAEDLAMLIAKEGGKPLVDAKVEVARAIDGIKLAAKDLIHVINGEEIAMGFSKSSENRKAFTINEPIGVVFAISAFNHPLNLIVHQIVPAIAVGCPVIIKPAKKTPLCCVKLVDLIHKAGLPKAWCQSVVCETALAEKIVSDDRLGFFSFIGSAKVGWYLRSKMAGGTRCSLEHGGIAPVIVDETVSNLDSVVSAIVKGGFYHAGQVCISVQRVYVSNKIINDFTKDLVAKAKVLKVGDPTKIETEVGPLINHNEVKRVDEFVKEAVKEGATLLCGGNKISDSLYEATVLLNPSDDSKVSTKEIFGPVVCVYGYDNLDEAIAKSNTKEFAFQSAIFSDNYNNIMQAFNNLDASAVIVNDHSAFRVDWMPFAGRKSSGYGIGGIADTMREMINYKMVVFKSDKLS